MTAVRHGTYAGWNWHIRTKTPTCIDCKEAARQYQAKRRIDPKKRQEDRDRNRALSRAVWRLADLHPSQFAALVFEERTKIETGERR